MFKKKTFNKLLLSIPFIILLIGISSAVTINLDTIYQTSVSNITINFTQTAYADSIVVNPTSLYFENFRRSGTEYLTFNITESGALGVKNYTGNDLPYFSSSTPTEKHITSNLSESVNATIIFEVDSCANIRSAIVTPNGESAYEPYSVCDTSTNILTIYNSQINPQTENNIITITYNPTGRNAFCEVVTTGVPSFFSTLTSAFALLAVVIILGLLFMVFLVVRGDSSVQFSGFDTFMDSLGLKIFFISILLLGILAFVFVSVFGALCS